MRAFMFRFLVAAVIAAGLAGCAGNSRKPAGTSDSTRAAAPANLAPGEQIDYAGHRCGNPNLYVKTHLCVFPRR
ncbi:hypothetical protein CJU94_25745 [Paraburkholderia aromaticivorans]|uniref:Lipoprotein n=2 Tax=Paraburkholderia aromaticivorans TaxID=2026199 RepID=A0A248VT87_9BURK|nr:hypothetical protein CJU94_25745 [Paraburkholderia aromaticivorans]